MQEAIQPLKQGTKEGSEQEKKKDSKGKEELSIEIIGKKDGKEEGDEGNDNEGSRNGSMRNGEDEQNYSYEECKSFLIEYFERIKNMKMKEQILTNENELWIYSLIKII